ncbi:MAG: pseudouridine synthase [Candidatus Saccharibacteria bacterium]|nr:pseudouridine synthase [Candidatus Saccharibacteria bacterium]
MSEKSQRLNKQLALWQGISRRQADDLIASGQVTVNNQKAVLGQRISETDLVKINNIIVKRTQTYRLIAVNKPTGITCSRSHQGNDKTIYDILPANFKSLKTVGRLDKDSSGLILMSNDGDFIYRMTHPSFHKLKIYKVRLDRDLEPLHQQMINDFGVNLPDGRSQLQLERLSHDNRQEWQITMSEGRNRQIRRTFAALGYEVVKLHRIQFDKYQLTGLKSGDYLEIK